jgi:hypothetical protein
MNTPISAATARPRRNGSGVPVAAVEIDRERWTVERSEELRLERLVRRGATRYARENCVEVLRIS